ncbi:MAG: ABC-2 transporter permease [Romboutsia sp.]|uniref:ABC-2 transporter permease n=1 Tax=Clostridium sp. DSM 8431 TaxID=1761781 RepID=UPI0008DFBACD|nr:ABC-2 transporter permease [Clostridium sp. DSM 8431]MBQ3423401.1 ABC-2 transporter permease [Romboutsia sp.]SFU52947.1 ABC-2 family transporter protein [Clostridium sp. DSM 8431]
MFTLLKKDIYFCSKYIGITVVFCILSPILLVIDGDNLYQLLSFYIPMVALGVIIGKICYIEDSDEVKMFLRSLPYKRSHIIICKYLEVLILNVISILYVSIVQRILEKSSDFGYILEINLLVGAFFMFYYSIYLFLYFKKNYHTAQNTMYIVLAIIFVCVFISNRNMISKYDFTNFFNIFTVGVIYLLSLMINYISMNIVIKGEN